MSKAHRGLSKNMLPRRPRYLATIGALTLALAGCDAKIDLQAPPEPPPVEPPAAAPPAARPQAPPGSESVEIFGKDPLGRDLRGRGVRTGDGKIALADTTTPSFDPATGTGGIYTYQGFGVTDENLPGNLYTVTDPEVTDPEAIAGHALSRYVIDYFRDVHGRNSWDGKGGSLIGTVNYGGPEFCNAFFSAGRNPPQMVFGDKCVRDGAPQSVTDVEIDTTGHEITHGVTATSSDLAYSGQTGALNESFSDYFGNVIGNRAKSIDNDDIFEDSCFGLVSTTDVCKANPSGRLSTRWMITGNTFADYLYLLDLPYGIGQFFSQDHGGVHLNSGVWNNVLWSIRTRLAQIDGVSGNESPRALAFDRIVYAALTAYLTPTSDFLAARAAIEQAARDLGADPTTLQVITEQFDLNKICAGCADPESFVGQLVAGGGAPQKSPVVSGGRFAWIEFEGGTFGGRAMQMPVGGTEGPLSSELAGAVGFAGPDALVAMELAGDKIQVARYDLTTGQRSVLDEGLQVSDWKIGIGGSDDGAAWANSTKATMNYVDRSGTVTTAKLLSDDELAAIAAGGSAVALTDFDGNVVHWNVGSDPVKVADLEDAEGNIYNVLAVAVHGSRIVGVYKIGSDPRSVVAFDTTTGQAFRLGQGVMPFGVALSADYAVWVQDVGPLTGGVVRTTGSKFADTNLNLYSFRTGNSYSIVNQRGQQAFPALSGTTLVWQDAVNGGDDIYATSIPSDL